MTEARKTSLHPISETLLNAYRFLVRQEGISFEVGAKNIQSLDSIVKTVHSSYFGLERYPKPAQKAAAYFYYIIKNHPMVDGNKRLAVLWLQLITASQFQPIPLFNEKTGQQTTPDELAIAVEASIEDHDAIIQLLSKLFESVEYVALPAASIF
jgi:prophage maintenance system killer protein